MAMIEINCVGGPCDGPKDVKDTGNPLTVKFSMPNGRMAVYLQAEWQGPALFQGYEAPTPPPQRKQEDE